MNAQQAAWENLKKAQAILTACEKLHETAELVFLEALRELEVHGVQTTELGMEGSPEGPKAAEEGEALMGTLADPLRTFWEVLP